MVVKLVIVTLALKSGGEAYIVHTWLLELQLKIAISGRALPYHRLEAKLAASSQSLNQNDLFKHQ